MEGTEDDEPQKVLSAFVKQFYDTTPYVPPRLLLQHEMDDSEAVEAWLSGKARHPRQSARSPAGPKSAGS